MQLVTPIIHRHLAHEMRHNSIIIFLFAYAAINPLSAEKKPMNVVVMLADDWRYDTLGAAGNTIVKTPHLDKLAANGVNFSRACVTTSICGVSRASIMTGQWMSRHKNRGFKGFDTPWEETYPGILGALAS